MLVVTTDTLPGYDIQIVLGEVVGVLAVDRNKFLTGMKALAGEPIDRPGTLRRNRLAAIRDMQAQAEQIGANAVVGMRFTHREVTAAWTEVCAYGTAVFVGAGPDVAGRRV